MTMHKHDDAWIYEAFSGATELPASLEERLAETYETIRREGRGKEPDMTRKTKKSMRTAALLAAAVAALTISAVAVYQRTVGDAVLGGAPEPAAAVSPSLESAEPAAPETAAPSAAGEQWLRLSLNGFSDSPEYKAYAEWTAWNDAWWAENPDPWAALGEDDSYYETPENYANLYIASFPAQAEKLDEIMEKYDLTPHTAQCWINSEEDLCQFLGVEDIFSDDYDVRGEYIYDDGSFSAYSDLDGTVFEKRLSMFLAVKGSFSMISGFMPASYEEWAYTTADGTEVLLALGHADGTKAEPDNPQDRSVILAELEGAYVWAGFAGVSDKAELERYADGIAFRTLNERFAPGADTSDIAAAVEARYAEEKAAMEQEAENMYAPFADRAERDAAVFADLGHYTIGDLPEGYVFRYDSAEWKSDRVLLLWDASEEMAQGTETAGGSTWKGDESDGTWRFLHLSYLRYYDRNDMENVTNEIEFKNAKRYCQAYTKEYTETTVNGYEAFIVRDEWGTPDSHYLIWFDTDRGLQFTLYGEGFNEDGNVDLFTDAELIAMAESVTEG